MSNRLALFALAALVTACSSRAAETKLRSKKDKDGERVAADAKSGPGLIRIDGSSTVYPITEAVAEEFKRRNKKASLAIGVSGTGGGFKKFCAAETSITGASRPIRPIEVELCANNGVEYIELPVAYDGIAIVVNPTNDWVGTMTVAELKRLWAPEAQKRVKKWSDVRPEWPSREIHLLGPGVDSGTYDYFTKAIVGIEHASRGDFVASEDDNVLVQGVSTDPFALGFFGYAYYSENQDKLKVVPIDDEDPATGSEGVVPTLETVANGSYQPLSRPVFLYVSKQAAERADVAAFVDYYIGEGAKLSAEVGYIPLPERAYELVRERFNARTTGSLFLGEGSEVGVSVQTLLGG